MEISTESPAASQERRFLEMKALRIRRLLFVRMVKDVVFISAGVLSAAFGLKAFLLPNNFLDGGVMGISLLVNFISGIDLAYLVVLINAPFIFIAYLHISRKFALRTLIAIFALALCLAFLDFPIITSDKLLIAFFGGFFLGAGIGLSIRGGSVIDGTEVLAIYTSRKSALTVGDFILVLNIIIFSVAAWLINMETALYAILTYLVASKTVDFVVHGIEEYISVMIVSQKSEEIKTAIAEKLGRGVTILKGKSGFGKQGHRHTDVDIIYSVITRLELQRLRIEIAKIDVHAFIVEQSVNDIKGGMIKRHPMVED